MPQTMTKQHMQEIVFRALAGMGVDPSIITLETELETIEVDSLDLVELAQIVEDECGVELKSVSTERVETVGHAIDLFAARLS